MAQRGASWSGNGTVRSTLWEADGSADQLHGVLRQECGAKQVWDYNRSAEMRDTEGGASKRSVLEQAEKLKRYLGAEGL